MIRVPPVSYRLVVIRGTPKRNKGKRVLLGNLGNSQEKPLIL